MITAIVVLHYPDLTVLDRLLMSLSGQVDRVVAVDNTPSPSATMLQFLARCPYPISYVPLGQNRGIGDAQNIGIREGISRGCSHVLLLDQDSAPHPEMVARLIAAESELLNAGVQVAAVGPRYTDQRTGTPSCAVHRGWLLVRKTDLDPRSGQPVETDNLIASGSIIRSTVFQSVGLMRDDLFMDFVDTEWGLRARNKGFKSYCVPNALMMHSVGDATIRVLSREIYLHNNLRSYYKLRNAAYLLRLSSMGWRWRSFTLRWIPYYLSLTICTSDNKLRNALLLVRALWDGLRGKLGRARQPETSPAVNLDRTRLTRSEQR